ncbi:MAG: SOS response-associated peptidase [Dehalococcoidia bacterium]|nr:SOS response-associated peptidase [Dehalococcoidia bacterium]
MCGRFTLTTKEFATLAAELGAVTAEDAARYRPRYNVAPTDAHWLLRLKREERQLLPARWGLVNSWCSDAKGAFRQINARAESAITSPAFRDAFVRRRCIVPADGFFEWQGAKDARRPVWFHAPDGGLLHFAGLYESWRDPATDAWQRTFTILTTTANDVVAQIHDRMPVILAPESAEEWLFVPPTEAETHAARLATLLRPAPSDAVVATEVSSRVNSVANDDPSCLTPAAASVPAARQGALL